MALLCAVLAVLAFCVMSPAVLLPAAGLALAAAAGLFVIAALIEAGMAGGLCVYAATAALALIILPIKTPGLLFLLFFGLYPMVKSRAERMGRARPRICIKIVFANLALIILCFVSSLFSGGLWFLSSLWAVVLTFAALNLLFVIYDIALTRLIEFYIANIRKRIRWFH